MADIIQYNDEESILNDHEVSVEDQGLVELGQWWWYSYTRMDVEYRVLRCITEVGSNYVNLSAPSSREAGTASDIRIHMKNITKCMEFEPNADKVIKDFIGQYQNEVNLLMGEIKEVTMRLGVYQGQSIEQKGEGSTAIAVMNSAPDVEGYKNALIKAKDKDLPELFKKMKEANTEVARWMTAQTLPMLALAGDMKSHVKAIEDRIFSVSIYAGLVESIVQCQDGEPAEFHEKLNVMQRRLYMDEESLLAYEHGGMEFKNIEQFDAWLCRPENLNRLMPFPRTMVTFMVRRYSKDRDNDGSLWNTFINIQLEKMDKYTFLYIRNGDKVYRVNTELDFDHMMFPDSSAYKPGEPMMCKMHSSGKVEQMMTAADFEERYADQEKKIADSIKAREEFLANTDEQKWKDEYAATHFTTNNQSVSESTIDYAWRNAIPRIYGDGGWRGRDLVREEWHPFNEESVYYDDILKVEAEKIRQYNRVAILIQGIFDRSEALHPHPPVKTWTADGFEAAVNLVYDSTRAIYNGPAPDFEAYRTKLNRQAGKGSMFIGQQRAFLEREAKKENTRIENLPYDDRKHHRTIELFQPQGNPGPGYIAVCSQWSPTKQAADFTWGRQKQRGVGYFDRAYEPFNMRTAIRVPVEELFCLDGYQLGDYKQFFQDPRTRSNYIKWAPILLAAEEVKANPLSMKVSYPFEDNT